MPSRGRRKQARAVLALAVLTALSPFSASAAPKKTKPPARPAPQAAPPTPVGPPPPQAPLLDVDPEWRQIMMAPAITGNLRTLAVDPSDEKNIYVATQEGTLAHSFDGGVTWSEVALSPFTTRTPSIDFYFSGDPMGRDGYFKAIDVFNGMKVTHGDETMAWDPLGRPSADVGPDVAGPMDGSTVLKSIRLGYPSATTSIESTVVQDAVPYDDIQQVIVCPGGANSVFVVTTTKLLGSADGARFVQLYAGRDSAPLQRAACSPLNPDEVVLTSGDGTFRSTDGGFTFETIGQVPSWGVTFAPPDAEGFSPLLLIAGGELWVGDSAEPDLMRASAVGGEGIINSLAVTASGVVWLATESGVRVSLDHANTWMVIEELEGMPWSKIAVSVGPDGKENILALRDDSTYLSTDGGETFRPSFRAESRRRLRWVEAMPASANGNPNFLILTSGEVWTSRTKETSQDPKLAEVRAMATRRIKAMPPLRDLLDRAALQAQLSDMDLDSMRRRWQNRGWLPSVDLGAGLGTEGVLRKSVQTVSSPQTTIAVEPVFNWQASVNLTWELPEAGTTPDGIVHKIVDLYELRKRLSYFIEDAYLEERQILSQLEAGGIDEEQALTLQARLDVLDVVLEEFTARRTKH